MADDKLTHFDEAGRARMVDVSEKPATARTATAKGLVRMNADAYAAVESRRSKKGDAPAVAELAGVMGAKKTADLIPLCHPLPLTGASVEIRPLPGELAVEVTATVKTTNATGVEMEALTAVSVACLTLYDMLKAVDRTMVIERIMLVRKTGGASGDFARDGE